jgi:3-deoxy-D-manno-octulosonic-acid transferase
LPATNWRNLVFFYRIFIALYSLGIRLASLWNKKAAEWLSGRKALFHDLRSKIPEGAKIIWMHCASAGEFEQGKPVIEALKKQYPHHKLLVSFFSPSGFSVGKKYKAADFITYLPLDTKSNAAEFLKIVNPELVIFIKYEYWYHHLKAVRSRNIPLLLVAAIFRKDQVFFKWYGGFYRKILFFFHHIFVQDQASLELLTASGINHCSIGGDTRFDRVKEIRENFSGLSRIEEFTGNHKIIVAGSTWPEDEKLLSQAIEKNPGSKLIIAPHEINEEHLASIEKLFPKATRYSKIQEAVTGDVLIIDNFGMLSRLYQYATIAYIGGGFNKSGIHNTLEAAVYGKPVLFGPAYQKFKEARELIEKKGAFSFSTAEELSKIIASLLTDAGFLQRAGEASKNYVLENTGATGKLLQFIQANRLLTR